MWEASSSEVPSVSVVRASLTREPFLRPQRLERSIAVPAASISVTFGYGLYLWNVFGASGVSL